MSRFDVSGKVAVVTGGASGFGERLCHRLASKGCRVVVGDVSEAGGRRVVKELEEKHGAGCAVFGRCDVTKFEDNQALFDLAFRTFGSVDIFVGNAGIPEKRIFTEDGDDTWKQCLDVCLTGAIIGTRMALTAFEKGKKDKGAVVLTSSMAGLFPVPDMPVYAAAKTGVVAFVRSLAGLKSRGIRANCICPGGAQTGFTATPIEHRRADGSYEERPYVKKSAGDWLDREQVVDAIMHAIEDESIFGEALAVTIQRGIQVWPHNPRQAPRSLPFSGLRAGGPAPANL
ncbi:hypothetical protein DFJ74DRAFT_679751 [Hyaloraphidium curvatum]|nr:hypothetical protein DFJ74DRAFT_679751 [Hyaloraphidium curvatum]